VTAAGWLASGELRVGLGCMRLSTDADRDLIRAAETIAAAVESGITVFDTARAYALDESELGHNERLLAQALRARGAETRARIVTKGGMTRPDGAWLPDGRAKAIRADCEASLAALDGLPIDLYLLHAPDPRTPWATSLRGLAKLVDDGLVARIGLANVSRAQLDEALELAPIAAVQGALSPLDDSAFRSGVFERCRERDLVFLAHSPLGGPKRSRRLERVEPLSSVAEKHGASAAETALAWLLSLGPNVVAVPGARRPGAARSAAAAARLPLGGDERRQLDESLGRVRSRPRRSAATGTDVVLVMGIPGAGKSTLAEAYVARDFVRLNRDELGGTLRDLSGELAAQLAAGAPRLVLDNTYLTRAARSHVLEVAQEHGAGVHCVWLDTPLSQAQINLVARLLDRFGSLPEPDELKVLAKAHAGVLTPTSQMRSARELEPPDEDEGFFGIQRIPFERVPTPGPARGGVLVAAAAIGGDGWNQALASVDPSAPHLIFDWRPDGADDLGALVARIGSAVTGKVETAVCTHPAGPPVCWCRPPLPGLALAFARRHGLDLGSSTVVGASPAHRTLANALGSRFVSA
jgi:aryl-alcohol dehydrogenase-like predicted oxidoreductase/predicted kinase